MQNVIIIAVLAVILGGAVAYIVKAKQRGVKCIGCSAGGCGCNCESRATESAEGGCCCCQSNNK